MEIISSMTRIIIRLLFFLSIFVLPGGCTRKAYRLSVARAICPQKHRPASGMRADCPRYRQAGSPYDVLERVNMDRTEGFDFFDTFFLLLLGVEIWDQRDSYSDFVFVKIRQQPF